MAVDKRLFLSYMFWTFKNKIDSDGGSSAYTYKRKKKKPEKTIIYIPELENCRFFFASLR
jgi:hypothetical protein